MNKIVWCIWDMTGMETTPKLIAIVDDEDKAIRWKRNNPELNIMIEEWDVK